METKARPVTNLASAQMSCSRSARQCSGAGVIARQRQWHGDYPAWMSKRPDPRRLASRYDGAYGLAGHPEAGVLPGDYRVPGTSLTPHQWQQELRRRLRDGLDLAGAPLYPYRIVDTRDGSLVASRPTLRAANRRRPRKCFYRVEHDGLRDNTYRPDQE